MSEQLSDLHKARLSQNEVQKFLDKISPLIENVEDGNALAEMLSEITERHNELITQQSANINPDLIENVSIIKDKIDDVMTKLENMGIWHEMQLSEQRFLEQNFKVYGGVAQKLFLEKSNSDSFINDLFSEFKESTSHVMYDNKNDKELLEDIQAKAIILETAIDQHLKNYGDYKGSLVELQQWIRNDMGAIFGAANLVDKDVVQAEIYSSIIKLDISTLDKACGDMKYIQNPIELNELKEAFEKVNKTLNAQLSNIDPNDEVGGMKILRQLQFTSKALSTVGQCIEQLNEPYDLEKGVTLSSEKGDLLNTKMKI